MAPIRSKARSLLRDKVLVAPELEPVLGFLKTDATRGVLFSYLERLYPPTSSEFMLMRKAYDIAEREFDGILRDGGERYMRHLDRSTLNLVVYLRCEDPEMIAAELLHDIDEDIPSWSHNRLQVEFGTRVAELVWWNTKHNWPEMSDEDLDRAFHAQLNRAPRDAIMIKLSERLDNLMTLWHQDVERIRRKVSETHNFYLPLAQRHHIMINAYEYQLRHIETQLLK